MAIYISGPNRDPLSHDVVEWILKDTHPYTAVINPSKIFYMADVSKRMPPRDVLMMRTLLASECQTIVLIPGWEKSYKSCCEVQSYILSHEIEGNLHVEELLSDLKTGKSQLHSLIVGDDPVHINALKETCRKRIRRHFKKL